MMRIRTTMFGVVGLLASVLSTAALASVSKPTAEERAACMGDAMTLCITRDSEQGTHRFVPRVEDVPTQPAVPGAVR